MPAVQRTGQSGARDRALSTVHNRGRRKIVAILDAKWKRLDLAEPNSGVSSGDAYQMNAYATRYRCKRLALVYPASRDCPRGRITEFVLMTEERPVLDVVAVDVRELAFGSGIPTGVDAMIPIERNWKQRTSMTPIYEAI
jgi:5-methylcytosine-specific restriction enzyme subunit McrC